jgi:hypothetical protein
MIMVSLALAGAFGGERSDGGHPVLLYRDITITDNTSSHSRPLCIWDLANGWHRRIRWLEVALLY